VRELHRILKECGQALKDDAESLKRANPNRRMSVRNICFLALKYHLNLKATCEYLEEREVVRYGTYERMINGGIRPMKALTEVWNELSNEEREDLV
jgi:hypothetical protein